MTLIKNSFIFILIVFFSGLIVRQFLISSSNVQFSHIEGLENKQSKCSTKRENGCKSIAVERNAQNIIYTNTLKTNTHKDLNRMINKISKLINKTEDEIYDNEKNIKKTKANIEKVNSALKPDSN